MRINPTPKGSIWAVCVTALALAAVTVLLFWPAVHSGFAPLDDPKYVRDNPSLQEGFSVKGVRAAFSVFNEEYWIPVLFLSYMTDIELFGAEPWGLHLTNILLHAANVILLFLLLRSAVGSIWPGFLAAALFAFHPLRAESVVWITARKDLLSGLFLLLAAVSYFRFARTGRKVMYGATSVFMLLGLMTKPVLVTFPLLMLIVDYWPLGRLRFPERPMRAWWGENRLVLLEKIPFLLLSLVFSLTTLVTQGPHIPAAQSPLALFNACSRALVSYLFYLRETLVPIALGIRFDEAPWSLGTAAGKGLVALAFHLAILSALLRLRKGRPYLLAGWLWYLISLFPNSGIIPVGAQWVSDRFTYIPHMGLFAVLAWLTAEFSTEKGHHHALAVLSAVAIAACAGVGRLQVMHWSDPVAMARRSVDISPENPFVWRLLGDALDSHLGDTAGAIEAYERAIELSPGFADAHNNLGTLLSKSGRTEEAAEHILNALALDPDHVEAHNSLGAILLDQGKVTEATELLNKALRLEPEHARAHNNLGNALLLSGDTRGAIGQFEEALRDQPSLPEAHNGLGKALADLGESSMAIEHLELALRLKDRFAEAHNNLGIVLSGMSRNPEAAEQFRLALRDDPDNAQIRNNFGNTLMASGNFPDAEKQFREALQLDPGFSEAHNNLGMALNNQGKFSEAILHYFKALETQPETPQIHYNLADALLSSGRINEAADHYERAITLGFQTADVHNNLGVAMTRMGRFQDAVAHFQKAMELAPDDLGIRLNLGNALLDAGRPDEAAAKFEEVLKLSPGNPVAAGRLERAKRMILSGK